MYNTVTLFKSDWVTIKFIINTILQDESKYSTVDKLFREIEKSQNNELINAGEKVRKNKNKKEINIRGLDIILEKVTKSSINTIKEEHEDRVIYKLDKQRITNKIKEIIQKERRNNKNIDFDELLDKINELERYYVSIIENKEKDNKNLYVKYANELRFENDEYQHEIELLSLKIDNLNELLKSSKELNEVYKKERDYFKKLSKQK
ncbi:Uncharacterised protein [Staphylococcus argenteus]|uniref:hypothetical protein n=1 Tax=Staphylococcus argenteus TaxID=985002 RepID=UPI000913D1E7|nr:hypothetical protein [Staphylococcus argenteus]SHE09064.1 Uncharacterised protein [Staphylococcus argenteus]